MRSVRGLVFGLLLLSPAAAFAADFDIPPDLGAYTVLSCQDMQMSGNSAITSEGVVGGTGGDGVAHVRSNGNVVISGTVEVHGNVTAGPGKQVITSGTPHITGTRQAATSPYNCTPIDLAALRTTLEAHNDNTRVPRTDKNHPGLSGGDGRTLTMSGNDGLTLPAGTYLFSNITLSGNSQLRVSGQVRILVTGSIAVSGGSHINLNGNPFQMRLWSQGSIAVSSQSNVHAYLYAPTAAVSLSGQMNIVGAIQTKSLQISGGVHIRRTLDDALPTVTLTAPADGASVTACQVTVSGRATDPEGPIAQVKVNGVVVPTAADGSFSTSASLATADPGLIEVLATDGVGNVTRQTRRVSIVEPTVALTTPASGTVLGSRTVNLAGTCGNATTVKVNGLNATVVGNGTFRLDGFDLGATDGLVTLNLSATNCGGSASATAVLDLDTKAPVVAIDTPANNYLASETPIVVSGTVSDAHLASVKVNGVTAQIAGSRFTATGVPLSEGDNPIAAVATDTLGRVTTSSAIHVELDRTAPGVTIASPANNAIVTTTAITVQGTVTDSHPSQVKVNGVTATLAGNAFTATGVPVAEGENHIVATATDTAGHSTSTQPVVVVRDTLPPTVTLDTAALPALTENATVTVRGTVSDPHLDKVTVNGVVAIVDGTSWAAEGVTLQEGANPIAAHAVDTLGHSSDTPTASVTRDSLPPQIAITEPAANAPLASRTITVRGTVSDPHLDRVSVLGVPATVTGGTFEALNVLLPEGASQIAAHAADTLSHEADAQAVAVVVDTLPPVVHLDSPSSPAVATATVTVTGTVEEPHLDQLTVAGIAATVNADGTFSVPGVPLSEGSNEIRAVARDTFGHETTSGAVTYDLDTTAPQIAITSPLDGQALVSLQVPVTGTVNDSHLASVTVNGVAATLDAAAGTFSALVSLTDGANTLTAIATDDAGHQSQAVVTVTLDSSPPAVTLDQPVVAAGSCLPGGSPVTLGGVFGDASPASGQNGQPVPLAIDVRDASGAHRSYAGTVSAGGLRWSAAGVDLGSVDGVSTVLVTATDAQRNSARVSASFRVDATPPAVSLLLDGAPFPGAAPGATAPAGTAPVLLGRAVRAAASVRDGAAGSPPPAVLTLDGAPYAAGTPIAAPGNHLLVATATDCAGHTSATHALFAIDTAAPALLSTSPAEGARVTVAPSSFSGTSDPDLASATVAGRPAVVAANGAFSLAPFDWRQGKNEVAIQLEDRAGNRASYTVTFTARTAPLSVSILEGGAPIAAGTTFLRIVRPEIRPSDSSATVTATLNGAPFVSGTAIQQGGSYTLAAEAHDDWGRTAQAQATFTVDLGAAPQIAITAPADGAVLSSAAVRVEGTVSGDAPTVSVNGVAATVTGSTWSIATLPLEADVANILSAVARDRRGRTASAGVTVRVVSGGPQVLILEPADGTTTNRSAIDVAGVVVGGRSRSADGKVTVQGAVLDLAPDGSFRAQDVALQSGLNTLAVSVKDREGRTGSASVAVRADFTPPTLRFLARDGSERPLLDGASFGRPITLVIEVADDGQLAGAPSVRLNGALQGTAAAPRTEIPLDAAGGYVVSVSVRDSAGNETRGERSLVLDFGGCALSEIEPVAGSGVTAASVTLVGRAVGAATLKVRVPQSGGGVQEYAANLADGTFLAGDLPLPLQGVNQLELVCTDASGRAVSLPYPIERLAAGTGPSIHITVPVAGAAVSADTIAVSGTVSGGTVTVNGAAATLQPGSPQSTFHAAAVPLAEGPNPLLARALDSAGRGAEDRVVVSRDTQAPRVQITRPDNHSKVGAGSGAAAAIEVSGLVDLDTEPNLDRVVVSTSAGSVTASVDPRTGIFLAQAVPLDPAAGAAAEQTITAAATDTLGHSGQSSVVVSFDPAGPALVLRAPADLTRFPASATAPIAIQGEAWAAPGAAISVNGIDLDPALLAWEAPGADGRRHVSFTTNAALPTVAAEGGAFGIIARVTDLQGRLAQDRRLLFRDAQAPRVVEFVPADGATGVGPNGLLLVLFSEPILHASLDAADGLLLTRVSTGQTVVGTKTVAGQAVAFAPGVALAAGESYVLHAGLGVTDLAGNALAGAAEARFTVATASTSSAPVLDPLPAVLCTAELQIKGHAAAGTTIKVRDGDLVFTGFADASGAFTVSLPVTGSGYHLIAAWSLDAATGARSAETSTVVRIDCQAPAVVDAVLDRANGVLRIVFSEAVAPATLTVGGATDSVRLLDAEVPGVYQGGSIAFPSATSAEVQLDPAADAWWRDHSVRLQVGPPAADPEGNVMAAVFERVFFPGGGDLAGGFLFGEVYDDSTGRPQGSAAVGLYASGQPLPGSVPAGQSAAPVTGAVSDGRGRFVLAGEVPAGRYVLVSAGAQTTRVYRHLSLRPSAGIVPFDSRVTPLAAAAGTLQPASGGTVGAAGYSFAADPAALPGSAPLSVRLTPLSGQGLPDFLPLGWTPAVAVELRLEGASVLPEQGLWTSGAARVELPLPAWAGAGTEIFAVRYEVATGRWLALPTPERIAGDAGQPARARVSVAGPGTIAIVVPDSEPANRPPSLPATADEPLAAAERPEATPALTAVLTLDPPVIGPTGRSKARVVARATDGASLWPSGLAVQAYLEEKLILTSGGEVFEAPFSADLVLYHPPLSAAEQGSAAAGAAGAMDFAVSPSPRAAQVLLDVGFENIRLFPFPEEVERGPVVGPDGGTVTSPAGVELTVSEGALSAKVPVAANLLSASELAALPAIAGYDVLAGVRVELSGATLARPATLSLPKPSTAPTETLGEPKVILAEWLEAPEDGRGAIARLAARTQRLGSGQTERIVASPDFAATLPLDGVVREGLYLLLAAHQPLGFATGLVKVEQGQGGPLAASRVTADGLGTGDLSRLTGRYALPVSAGAGRVVTAVHPTREERGSGTIANLAPGQVASLDLVVQAVAPHVVSVAPADGATNQPVGTSVSVLFSEPLAAATVTSSTLNLELLDPTGAPTGVFAQGTVSLIDGVRAVFAPTRPLLPGRGYRAAFAGGVADAGGTIYAGGPVLWSFTTSAVVVPGGQVHPEKFHVRLPVNGVAQIYGDPGALPTVTSGPAWIVSPEIDGPAADPVRDSFSAHTDGSFAGTVGHPPGFAASLESKIYVKVFDPTGTLAAQFRVGPFTTPDGLGFVAPAGEDVTFRSAEGLVVDVPAAAFDKATLVNVRLLNPSTLGVAVPQGLALGAYVDIDFDGEAKETLRVAVPAPAGAAEGAQVFMGQVTQLPWGPRLQLLSAGGVLARDGQRYLSNDPSLQPEPASTPLAAPSHAKTLLKEGARTCRTVIQEGLNKCFLASLLQEFSLRSHAAFLYESGVDWSLISGLAQPFPIMLGMAQEAIFNFVADSWVYLPRPHDWNGGFVLPVISSQPLELARRDAATGWLLARQTYDPVAGSNGVIDVGFLGEGKPRRPLLIDAKPFQLFRLPAPLNDGTTRLSLEMEMKADASGRVTLSPVDGFPLAKGSSLTVYDLAPTTPEPPKEGEEEAEPAPPIAGSPLSICDPEQSWTTTPLAGSDDLLVVLAPGGLDASIVDRLELQFDLPLREVKDKPTGEVARLVDLGPLEESCSSSAAAGYPRSMPIALELSDRQSRLTIHLASSLPAGHRFRLELVPAGLVSDDPSSGGGLAYWETAPTRFEFSTREIPGEPISGSPDGTPALGTTNVARDMLKLGNLLLVASETGDLVAFDVSRASEAEGVRRYALKAKAGTQTATRSLATDGHNRIFYSGQFGSIWGIKAIRLEDVREASTPCVAPPDWAQGLPCFEGVEGSVRIAYSPGASSGTTASEWLALGTLPEGVPMKLSVLTQDEKGKTLELADFVKAYAPGVSDLASLAPDAEGIYTFDLNLRSTFSRSSAHASEPSLPPGTPSDPPVEKWRKKVCSGEEDYDRYQRVTIDNLTTGQSWSIDVENPWPDSGSGNGVGVVHGVKARKGDLLRVRYNLRTLGHVALLGSGITVVDLNRFYRLTQPFQTAGSGQCGRRLGKFEGQQLEFPACAPPGIELDGIAMTPSLVVHSRTGCDRAPCRGDGFIDIYSPLSRVGALHTRSTVSAPGGVENGLFGSVDGPEALQVSDMAACIQSIGNDNVLLRDVALANNALWTFRGVHGQISGQFQEPPAGFKPQLREGDLLFVSLGTPGVFVFDVSGRSLLLSPLGGPALVGHLSVKDHSALRLQVDDARGLLFAGGTDLATGEPVIDVWDIGSVNGAPGLDGAPTPRATLHAPWSTNQLGIDAAGTGLLYTWGTGKGPEIVPFDRAQFVFSGLYRPEGKKEERGISNQQRPTSRFVPLGVPLETSLTSERANHLVNEEKATGAFKLRIALPGSLGPELTAKVQSLRSRPGDESLGQEDVGASVALPGGPGWPENEIVVRLRRVGVGSDEGGGGALTGEGGPLGTAYQLYESVETVLVLADPRARSGYHRQDAPGDDEHDEKAQCRRCDWPGYLPDPLSNDPALDGIKELVAGRYVRAFLFATADDGISAATKQATEAAIHFFEGHDPNYPLPAGVAEIAGFADSIPSPVQVSLGEPAQGAAIWSPGEGGVSVSLPDGDGILAANDHTVAGRALPFSLDRVYRSNVLGYGALGSAGWSVGLFAHLRELPATGEVEYYDGLGHVWRFFPRSLPAPPTGTENDESGSYYPPVGVYLRLLQLPAGQGWRMIGREHDVALFDGLGRLTELADRLYRGGTGDANQGNRMQLRYDPFGQLVDVEDDLGRRYTFEYFDDPRPVSEGGDGPKYGLLKSIEDFVDRKVEYEFDDDRRLTKVKLPEVSNPVDAYSSFSYRGEERPTLQYHYEPQGGVTASDDDATAVLHGKFAKLRLESYEMPRFVPEAAGVPRVRFEYDSSSGRVKKIGFPTPGNVNTSTTSVVWELTPDDTFPATRVTVGAPWGHTLENTLEHGRITRTREDLEVSRPDSSSSEAITTSFSYSDDGRLLSIDRPDGSRISRCYADGQGGSGCGSGGGSGGDRLARANVTRSITAALTPAAKGSADYETTDTKADFEEDNQLRSVTDGMGRGVDVPVSQASGRSTSGFAVEHISATFDFDRFGRVKHSIGGGEGGASVTRSYEPDARGRSDAGLLHRIDRGGAMWQELAYDDAFNLRQVRSSQGTRSEIDHDDWDREVRSRSGISEDGRLASVGAESCGEGKGALVERAFDAAGHVVRTRRLQDYVDPADGSVKCRWVESRYTFNAREQLVSEEQTHLASTTTPGQVVDAPQQVASFVYDEHGRLEQGRTRALSRPDLVTAFGYDAAGRVASTRLGAEGARLRGYDELSRLVLQTDGDQGRWRGQYDAWDHLYQEVAATGAVTRRRFDQAGNQIQESIFDSEPLGSGAHLLSDVRSRFTSFGAADRVTRTLAAAPGTGTPQIKVTENEFDSSGRVTEVWSGPPLANDDSRVDRSHGRREVVKDYQPDTGRLLAERFGGDEHTAPLHGVTYTYDSASGAPWPDAVSLQESVPGQAELVQTFSSRFRRDALGRTLEERRNDGLVRSSVYDRSGPAILVRTGAGTEAAASLDGAGRVVKSVRPNGRGFSLYAYDLDGALLREATRTEGSVLWETSFTYDSTGRVSTATYADGTTEETTYNPDSTLASRKARDGVRVAYTYDSANRVVTAVPSAGGSSVLSTRLDAGDRFSYDPLSRPTDLERGRAGAAGYDPSLAVHYPSFDLGSRPGSEVVGGRSPLSWAYDVFSRPVSVTLPAGVGRGVSGAFQGFERTYDSLDRLVEVSGLGAGGLSSTPLGAEWTWGGSNRLYGMETKGALGTAERFGYHGGGGPQVPGAAPGQGAAWKLATLTWGSAGEAAAPSAPQTPWGGFGFGWRGNEGTPSDGAKLGRLVLPAADGADLFAGLGWSWGYDGGVRLTSATSGSGDLIGQGTATGVQAETFRFAYGDGDQLSQIIRDSTGQIAEIQTGDYGRITGRSGATFSYDGVGRRLEDDRFSYRWNWRGELVEVTVKEAWPDGDGDGHPDVTPWAGYQVRYDYDANGRLTQRWTFGKLPEGSTDDAQRPFVEKRVFVWEGAGLAAEAAYGNAEETLLRWRKTYVPGPGGLDDAVQVVVEDSASGTTRTYTLVRDEMGTVTTVVAEDEGTAAKAAHPPVPVRYRYTPYGEAQAESGPELLRVRFDGDATSVAVGAGTVTQSLAGNSAAGSLLLDWSLPLDAATLSPGLVVERLVGPSGWVALSPNDFVVGPAPDSGGIPSGGGGPPARLLVLIKAGWARGASYRVRLASSLEDHLGRRFGRSESLEWRIPEPTGDDATPAVVFDQRFPLAYETWEAATNTVGNRFPGGQTFLFQGLWTDPVTGLAYARARWYDARNAVWLSEDPMGAVDSPNLYAFVGLQPNMGRDPLGQDCLGFEGVLDCGDIADSFLSVGAAKRTGQFLVGEAKGLAKAGEGLVHMVAHPIDTAEGLVQGTAYLAENWDRIDVKQVASNAIDSYVNASAEKQGEVFGEVVLSSILLGGVGKTAEVQKLSAFAKELASIGRFGDEIADAGMAGFQEGLAGAVEDLAPQISDQAILRQRVLGNIARSQAAREASNFAEHVAQTATETLYRSMSPANYESLLSTGRVAATAETFVSPSAGYAAQYEGVMVRFQLQAGATEALEGIGVRDASRLAAASYPNMPLVQKGWTLRNAFFKAEGDVINIGLGRGPALDTFNDAMVGFSKVPK